MKAVVLENRGHKAAILLKDGTFRVIRGRYTVGETIEYRERGTAARKWMAIAAAAVLAIGTGGGLVYDARYAAYAEVSLDVNPSILYTVNKQNCVLAVKAVNEEASAAVTALEEEGVRWMPVDEAIEKTMGIFAEEGYLSQEDGDCVLLNVASDDSRVQESVAEVLETGMELARDSHPEMTFRIDLSDRETARRASENRISTGRYAVWEREGGEGDLQSYAEMPVRDMLGMQAESAVPGEADTEGDGERLPEPSGEENRDRAVTETGVPAPEASPAVQEGPAGQEPGASAPSVPQNALSEGQGDTGIPSPAGEGQALPPDTGGADGTQKEENAGENLPAPPETGRDEGGSLPQDGMPLPDPWEEGERDAALSSGQERPGESGSRSFGGPPGGQPSGAPGGERPQ